MTSIANIIIFPLKKGRIYMEEKSQIRLNIRIKSLESILSFLYSEIKEQLYDQIKNNIGDCFIHKGKILMDDDTLEDYNIKNNDIITIKHQDLTGGPKTENKDYLEYIDAINKRGNIGSEYYYKIIGTEYGIV